MIKTENLKFKSIHIDIDNGIYEINGEKQENITDLILEWHGEGWLLNIQKDLFYSRATEKNN